MTIASQRQSTARPIAGFYFDPANDSLFFTESDKNALRQFFHLKEEILTKEAIISGEAVDIEFLISGWGASTLDASSLNQMPNLQRVLHIGGSVKGLVGSGAIFRSKIKLSSTNLELAKSVAEFCFAQILLSHRHFFQNIHAVETLKTYPPKRSNPYSYPQTVGLIGYGAIAKILRDLLRSISVKVRIYDPYVSPHNAKKADVELSSLRQLFEDCDFISCHLPHLEETTGILRESHFSSMKDGAVFLNTARGQVINEPEMIKVFDSRPDLWAILDVVAEEPIRSDHPFHCMHNIILSPHIAGCTGIECRRLGRFAIEEIERWINGKALRGEVIEENLSIKA